MLNILNHFEESLKGLVKKKIRPQVLKKRTGRIKLLNDEETSKLKIDVIIKNSHELQHKAVHVEIIIFLTLIRLFCRE